MKTIPYSLAPFFQEYGIAKLTPEKDARTIIERVLQFGNRIEIHWLFETYSDKKIKKWGKRWSKDKLPEPHRTFWRTMLEVNE